MWLGSVSWSGRTRPRRDREGAAAGEAPARAGERPQLAHQEEAPRHHHGGVVPGLTPRPGQGAPRRVLAARAAGQGAGPLRDLRRTGRAVHARPREHDVAGQREQDLRHAADVLVAHRAEDQDEGPDAAQVIGQRARRRRVVGAVQEERRVGRRSAPGAPASAWRRWRPRPARGRRRRPALARLLERGGGPPGRCPPGARPAAGAGRGRGRAACGRPGRPRPRRTRVPARASTQAGAQAPRAARATRVPGLRRQRTEHGGPARAAARPPSPRAIAPSVVAQVGLVVAGRR